MRLLRPGHRAVVEDALNSYIPILAPGVARLNADPFFASLANVGYATPDFGALAFFTALRPNVFDAHLLCGHGWRGSRALAFARAALDTIFTDEEAYVIVATIPNENLPSRRICRALGGIPIADTVDPFGRPCKQYALERSEWVKLSAAWQVSPGASSAV